jgi:HEAT repeat protein
MVRAWLPLTALALALAASGCRKPRYVPPPRPPVEVPADAAAEFRQALEKLDADDVQERAYGAWLLGELREDRARAVPYLLAALQDGNFLVRSRAAESLGKLDDRQAAGPLIAVLRNPAEDREVRSAAAEALGRLQAPEAVEALIGALNDIAWHVRYQALVALGRIADPASREALEQAARYDPELSNRAVARESLERLPAGAERNGNPPVGN